MQVFSHDRTPVKAACFLLPENTGNPRHWQRFIFLPGNFAERRAKEEEKQKRSTLDDNR
jgi:hypothetical protein